MAINFPEGTQNFPSSVLQAKQGYYSSSKYVTSSGSHNSLYGLTGNRVYGDLVTVSITPLSSSSIIIVQGLSGKSNSNLAYHSTGATGVVAILNNGSTGAIDNTNYQYYPLSTSLGSYVYLPNDVVQGRYSHSNTNAQSWTLKGYSYSEGGNTNRVSFMKAHLLLLEIEG